MLTEKQVKNNIQELITLSQNRRTKYYRNISFYYGTRRMNINNIKNADCVGLYSANYDVNDDTTPTPKMNVIKSVIDTLHSQISEKKVRPFFNCVDGTYKDYCIVKQAQQFFDQYFNIQDVNKKVSEAFRDACIFDTGYIYVDPDNKAITRALPWQVFERPAELTYNNVTRTAYRREDYPSTMLPDFIKLKKEVEYVTFIVYYDVTNETKAYYIPEQNIMVIKKFDGNRTPFIRLWFDNPIYGNSSSSIVDMLYEGQLLLNVLWNTIKDAAEMTPKNTLVVEKGSGVRVGQLNNRVGNIIELDGGNPNYSSMPFGIMTPEFLSAQYFVLEDKLWEKAYKLTGVSQLSANNDKPAGLNSGIAIQTMENIEAGRFQTQFNQVVRAYVDIAKTCLRVFPKDETILPKANTRLTIEWKDIVEETQKMKIQFSGADALSNDPSTKLQQLIALSNQGVIPKSRITQFMEIPDIDSGYSIANNAINAIMSIIDDCIEKDIYEVPDYIPLDMLEEEILNTQLSLRSANYELNKPSIEKLSILYSSCESKMEEMQKQAALETQVKTTSGEIMGEMVEPGMQEGLNPDDKIEADKDAFNTDLDVDTLNE